MKTSTTRTPVKGSMRARCASAFGFALAIGCILTTPPLRAEDAHRGGQQHSQRHAPRQQVYRHEDQRHGNNYNNQDYAYGAPPVVYAPAVVPGISLFVPL
ncbi:hypothetical protein [Paraburkholderia tagetis]|uniref:PXPV repeat-containing protein n=1 Tax=Paraburkholderia tagetis TaxID=2913261 RepID=A0A9X1RSH4_9BURK|nr:hypothetical protein [Paraburkholderia tagetis]MCG5076545.1 hypothetical protein [Paraburkholderia tagetis]